MLERVAQIISEQLGVEVDSIRLESNLVEDLKADSIDIVALVMDIESEYGIEVDDEELKQLKTVGDIIGFLEANK